MCPHERRSVASGVPCPVRPNQSHDPRLAFRICWIRDVEIRMDHPQLGPSRRSCGALALHIAQALSRILVDGTIELHSQLVRAIGEIGMNPAPSRHADLEVGLPPAQSVVLQHEPCIGLHGRVHPDDGLTHRFADPADAAVALESIHVGSEIIEAAQRRDPTVHAGAVFADHPVDDSHELLTCEEMPTFAGCRRGDVQQRPRRRGDADRVDDPEVLSTQPTPMTDDAAPPRPRTRVGAQMDAAGALDPAGQPDSEEDCRRRAAGHP